MKKIISSAVIISLIVFLLPGCQAIEGIFKAGVWTGIIVVVAIIALIIFLATRGKK